MGRNPLIIEKEELVEKLRELPTQQSVADYFGCSQATISNKIKEYDIGPKLIRKTPPIKYHEMPKFSWEELKEYLSSLEESESPTVGYDEVSVEIETNRPIELIPLADWHIGARWVEYNSLIACVEEIIADPNKYTLLCGDYCDNYNASTYRGGQLEERIPIQVQKAIAEEIIKKLAEKTISIINGCHDEWSYFNDGFDFGKYLSEKGSCYYLGHNGYINLKVGDVEYRLFVTHNTFRHSTINDGHGLRSALKEHGDFDVGISAHTHKPHVETFVLKGEKKWIMTCGGFKGQDRHISKGGFPPTIYCTPGMILNDKKKDVIMNIDYRKLEKYL